MTDINRYLTEKINSEDSKVVMISFKKETETLSSFLKEFKDYGIESVSPLFFKTKPLLPQKIEEFEKDMSEFSSRVFVSVHNNKADYYNDALKAGDNSMGTVRYINPNEVTEYINQYNTMNNYVKNLSVYHNKLLNKNFSENYINELSSLLSQSIDTTKFEKDNGKTLKDLISETYYLTKRLSNKNIFDFTISEVEGEGASRAIHRLSNKMELPNGNRNFQNIWALTNEFSIQSRGLNMKKIEGIILSKFKSTETLVSIMNQNDLHQLDQARIYKYIPTDTTKANGFTFSTDYQTVTDKSIFQIIINEVATVAIEAAKLNNTIELHTALKEWSKSSNGYESLIEKIEDYMEKDRIHLDKEWKLDDGVKNKPKKQKIKP